MVTLPVEAWKLEGISPRAYQHPADRAATAALQKVPYLDEVVRRLIALGYERALRAAALGASVRLGEHQLPNIWVLQRECFNALDLARVPDLYLTQVPFANAVTIGTDRPVVVLNSELVRILGDDGRRAVLAHEAGHVHSNHVLYQTALLILMRLSSAVRLPVLAGLPIMAIQFALLQDMSLTHPLPVRRVHHLLAWVRSGEYDRIVGGEYIRRGDVPPLRKEADAVQDHYGNRIADAFAQAGSSISEVGQQLGDWLSRNRDGDDA